MPATLGVVYTRLSAALATEANAVGAPIHPEAMPVLLTTLEDCKAWLTAPIAEALTLQQSLPDGRILAVVATTRSRQDEAGGQSLDGPYPPGEGRLVLSRLAGDLNDACTSAVKIKGGWHDGDHHWG